MTTRHLGNLSYLVIRSQCIGIKYPGEKCDFKASLKSNLTWNHLSVHMRIKYQFQECERKFTEKGKLTRYHKSAHIGTKYPHEQWATQKHN